MWALASSAMHRALTAIASRGQSLRKALAAISGPAPITGRTRKHAETLRLKSEREGLSLQRHKARRHHKRVSTYDANLRGITNELLRRKA